MQISYSFQSKLLKVLPFGQRAGFMKLTPWLAGGVNLGEKSLKDVIWMVQLEFVIVRGGRKLV